MQNFGSEMVIPLTYYKARIKRAFLSSCVFLIFFMVLFIVLFISTSSMAARMTRFPDLEDSLQKLMVFGAVIFVLILLLYGMLLTFLIRKLRSPSQELRIDHEGIFFSGAFIRWDEIVTLIPYTMNYLGLHPALGIVLRDFDVWLARTIEEHSRKSWQKDYSHFLVGINTRLSRHSNPLAPFNILQKKIPISIDELLTAIQEQFAPELREHHITVLEWQK